MVLPLYCDRPSIPAGVATVLSFHASRDYRTPVLEGIWQFSPVVCA